MLTAYERDFTVAYHAYMAEYRRLARDYELLVFGPVLIEPPEWRGAALVRRDGRYAAIALPVVGEVTWQDALAARDAYLALHDDVQGDREWRSLPPLSRKQSRKLRRLAA